LFSVEGDPGGPVARRHVVNFCRSGVTKREGDDDLFARSELDQIEGQLVGWFGRGCRGSCRVASDEERVGFAISDFDGDSILTAIDAFGSSLGQCRGPDAELGDGERGAKFAVRNNRGGAVPVALEFRQALVAFAVDEKLGGTPGGDRVDLLRAEVGDGQDENNVVGGWINGTILFEFDG